MASRPLAVQNFIRWSDCEWSHDRIGAKLAATADTAELATPDGIELLNYLIDKVSAKLLSRHLDCHIYYNAFISFKSFIVTTSPRSLRSRGRKISPISETSSRG